MFLKVNHLKLKFFFFNISEYMHCVTENLYFLLQRLNGQDSLRKSLVLILRIIQKYMPSDTKLLVVSQLTI